jgi:hypothetical protein
LSPFSGGWNGEARLPTSKKLGIKGFEGVRGGPSRTRTCRDGGENAPLLGRCAACPPSLRPAVPLLFLVAGSDLNVADDSAAVSAFEHNADKLAPTRPGRSVLGLTEQQLNSLYPLNLTRSPRLTLETGTCCEAPPRRPFGSSSRSHDSQVGLRRSQAGSRG